MEENNNFNLESGLSFYLFVMGLANLGPLSWIRGYLKNKPFGMQTLFDKVSISFTYAAQACQISFCLVIGIGLLIRYVDSRYGKNYKFSVKLRNVIPDLSMSLWRKFLDYGTT